jgi:dephospho-CoA kinase
MKIFGLTGGIGCGKSTVSKHWAQQGLPIIDPDILSRKAVDPNTAIGLNTLESIRRVFGDVVFRSDGVIDRKKMGSVVFSDKDRLKDLEVIMFPVIGQLMSDEISVLELKGYELACYDNALLIEKSNFENYRPIVVVHIDLDIQIQRVLDRNTHLSKDDVLNRIHSQISSDERLKYANYVIDNSGPLEDTLRSADIVLNKVKSL